MSGPFLHEVEAERIRAEANAREKAGRKDNEEALKAYKAEVAAAEAAAKADEGKKDSGVNLEIPKL